MVWTILILLLSSTAVLGATTSKKQAKEIAEQARERSDLRSPLGVPFRLNAQLILHDELGGTLRGSMTLLWLSSDLWREEVALPGYSEVRIGGPNKRWVKRNLDYEPLHVRMARFAVFPALWGIRPEEAIRRVRTTKTASGPETCLSLEFEKYQYRRELCFDLMGRLARSVEYDEVHEYSDYVTFGSKVFPRRSLVKSGGELRVEVLVKELVPAIDPAETLFDPPAEAEEWDWCGDMKSAAWVDGPMPKYDALSYKYLDAGAKADVIISSVIGKDGRLHDFHVLQTGGKPLDDASVEAMKQWVYKPAQCGDKPVLSEIVITFPYYHVKMTSDCPGIGTCGRRYVPRTTPVFTTPAPEDPIPGNPDIKESRR